jgi:hypothetical protein
MNNTCELVRAGIDVGVGQWTIDDCQRKKKRRVRDETMEDGGWKMEDGRSRIDNK